MSKTKLNYWLFLIMLDSFSKEYWGKMVQSGLAAQDYPNDMNNVVQNINKMRQIKKGDWIIAAFRNRRFGGYGQLQSDFYRSKKSLNITRPGHRTKYAFQERFMCEANSRKNL